MTWTTPKTDWSENDYYNLEDAQRIAGNICHLREMAADIYGLDTAYDLLVCRESHYDRSQTPVKYVRFFGILNAVTVRYLGYYEPSQYTRDLTIEWLNMDMMNLRTLFILKAFSVKPARHYVSNYWVDYNINSSSMSGSVYYSGYCIADDESYYGHYYSDPPIKSITQNSLGANDLPIKSHWSLYNGKTHGSFDYTAQYGTVYKFYRYDALNKIELVTRQVYEKFTEYLGG